MTYFPRMVYITDVDQLLLGAKMALVRPAGKALELNRCDELPPVMVLDLNSVKHGIGPQEHGEGSTGHTQAGSRTQT